MGHESLIDWISPEIALAYFFAATVVLVGVLQMGGAHWERPELCLVRSRAASILLGAALILLATFAFYLGMRPLIFVPGLAGTELIVLFGAAALLATIVVRLGARLLGRCAPAAATPPLAPNPSRTTRPEPVPGLPAAVAVVPTTLPDDIAWVTPPPAARREPGWSRTRRPDEP